MSISPWTTSIRMWNGVQFLAKRKVWKWSLYITPHGIKGNHLLDLYNRPERFLEYFQTCLLLALNFKKSFLSSIFYNHFFCYSILCAADVYCGRPLSSIHAWLISKSNFNIHASRVSTLHQLMKSTGKPQIIVLMHQLIPELELS